MPDTTCIALLTDFGTSDSYVAEMKAAMLAYNANLNFVDISHHVPPGDIRQAAYLLWRSHKFFPRGTIFLCVVDPGVGSDRRIIVARSEQHTFVAPDNGLLSMIQRDVELTLYCLDEFDMLLPDRTTTFDGRTMMAPAAASLSRGSDPESFCCRIDGIKTIDLARLSVTSDCMTGEVLSIDHFGNAISNIGESDLRTFSGESPLRIEFGEFAFDGLSKTYATVDSGKPLAYIGSCELLEIGINGGNLAIEHSISVGDKIKVVRNEQ